MCADSTASIDARLKGNGKYMQYGMKVALAGLGLAVAVGAAPEALAQSANPAVRGGSTTARVATQNRAAPTVTERAASGLSMFSATCGNPATAAISAEVEPHIAVNPLNPNNLVGSWQQDRHSNGAARGVVSGASLDGGATWTLRTIPVSLCTGGPLDRGTDPWMTFSPDGTVHQTVLGVSGQSFTASGVSEVIVSRSTDGGFTWSAPISLIRDVGAGLFNDKQTITADPTDARFVYAVWDRLRASGGGPTLFARTTDAGLSWEAAREIYDPGNDSQTIGNVIQVLPNGTLINLMTVIRPTGVALNVIRSTDRGLTWSAPIFVSTMGSFGARDPTTNAPIRDGAIVPQMAVAPDGTLYVVWQDARFTQQRDAIAISRSHDGGFTWTAPVRVNFNPNVVAFTPQVHVRADGVVGVTYYDLRSDTSSATTLLGDFWLARSTDGEIWTESRVSQPFDIAFAPLANGAFFLGDYTGLSSAGSTFIAFYGKTNATLANRTDIFAARIAPAVATAQASAAKRGLRPAEGVAYRAEPLPLEAPGPEFEARAFENAVRAMQARVTGWVPPAQAVEGDGAVR